MRNLFLNKIVINGNGVQLVGDDAEGMYHVFSWQSEGDIPQSHTQVNLIDESNLLPVYAEKLGISINAFSAKF